VPAGRTHRVYAIEGGQVMAATPRGERGLVDVGHFRYEHVDALVRVGQRLEPGQPVRRTWQGTWHVHLGERPQQQATVAVREQVVRSDQKRRRLLRPVALLKSDAEVTPPLARQDRASAPRGGASAAPAPPS